MTPTHALSHTVQRPVLIEALEGRRLMSGDVSDISALADEVSASATTEVSATASTLSRHEKHMRYLDRQAHLKHVETVRHAEHVHRTHMKRVRHDAHVKHQAHVLNTTVPEPIVLTAQQKNDWAAIRDEMFANQKRISK